MEIPKVRRKPETIEEIEQMSLEELVSFGLKSASYKLLQQFTYKQWLALSAESQNETLEQFFEDLYYLDPIQRTAICISFVSMDTSQFQQLSGRLLRYFGVGDAVLTPELARSLTPKQIADMGHIHGMLLWLTPEQLPAVDNGCFGQISPEVFLRLTTRQLQSLTGDQLLTFYETSHHYEFNKKHDFLRVKELLPSQLSQMTKSPWARRVKDVVAVAVAVMDSEQLQALGI